MLTILSPNLASNTAVRSVVLAEMAERMGEKVRIIGSVPKDHKLWGPFQSFAENCDVQILPLHTLKDLLPASRCLRSMLAECDGPLIITKPDPRSLGVALLAGVNPRGRGVVLDIDDWELSFRMEDEGGAPSSSATHRFLKQLSASVELGRMLRVAGIWSCEEVSRWMPHKTVTNTWLQKKFGGVVLPHVRDPDILHPRPGDEPNEVRTSLNMDDEKLWIGFIGTPREHKGVYILIEALSGIDEASRPGLAFFGCSLEDDVSRGIWEKALSMIGENHLCRKGNFPISELANHVAAVDVIAIPSLIRARSVGQIPAKLFDAMAMAKPIIVSDVNDMAMIVEGAGLVSKPGDVDSLRQCIRQLAAESTAMREARGHRARKRFLERYTLSAGTKILKGVLDQAIA
ncbi:MAG: glycosyltransferase [Myxococcales bacterium]|nr:glycosyltransferase [Myxococcales bacterium]